MLKTYCLSSPDIGPCFLDIHIRHQVRYMHTLMLGLQTICVVNICTYPGGEHNTHISNQPVHGFHVATSVPLLNVESMWILHCVPGRSYPVNLSVTCLSRNISLIAALLYVVKPFTVGDFVFLCAGT